MKLFYKGKKLTEILILTVAITIAVVAMVLLKNSYWLLIPYILLEIVILYFFLNFGYEVDEKNIKIKYGFFTWKVISILSVHKIFIQEKSEYAPKNHVHQVELHYNYNKIQIIVPLDTVKFIENIEKINPKIEIS